MSLEKLLTDLSKFKYTNYENVGANNSQVGGRHGGTVGPTPAQPPHPDDHSIHDDGAGDNLSQISGRHGGTEPLGQPPHPDDHSIHDDGVGGIGNPQSFNVRGYTITGTKIFDRPNEDAITIMTDRLGFPYTPFDSGVKTGPVDFLSGVQGSWGPETLPLGFSFNMVDSLLSPGTPPVLSLDTLRHTIPEVGPSPSFTIDYSRYDELLGSQFNTVDGIISSQHTDTEKLHSSYGTQFHISGFNRGDMYIIDHPHQSHPIFKTFTRGSAGLGKVGLTSPNFNPFEFGTDLPYVISQHNSTGPTQFTIEAFSDTPILADAHSINSLSRLTDYPGIYIGPQGEVNQLVGAPSISSDGITFTGPAGVFDHTDLRNRLYDVYQHHFQPTAVNFVNIPYGDDLFGEDEAWKGGSIHIGAQDPAPIIGGGVTYYGSLVPITTRSSIYRTDDGTYQVPQSGHTTIPPGVTTQYPSKIETFTGTQITHNLPQHNSTGPTEFTIEPFVDPPHSISVNAHGSDFFTTPLDNYESQFSAEDLQTDIDSGFNRGDMYITDHPHQSHPTFKTFTQGSAELGKIDLTSPNFDPWTFEDDIPYVIPQHNSTGPTQFTIESFSDTPISANAHSIDSLSRLTGYPGIYIGPQGEINQLVGAPSISSDGITFTGIDGAFNHTDIRSRLYKVYQEHFLTQPFTHIPLGTDLFDETGTTEPWKAGSIHIGAQDPPPLTSWSIDWPQFKSDFMSRLGYDSYQSDVRLYNTTDDTYGTTGTTVTHNVSMITLSGPTTQTYQTIIDTSPIATGAHGSDFSTSPIEAYSSIFATQDDLLMDTIYDSGFDREDMYIQNSPVPSTPVFKVFTQSENSLIPFSQWSPQRYGSNFVDTIYTFFGGEEKEFRFDDRIPYNIPARDNNVIGFDQPFILKDIGDKWGPGNLGAIDEGLFRGGAVTAAARTVADVLRIGKFILTPKGIMFGLKQVGLNLLNPFPHTRMWNPLSLGSLAPMVHIDRHLDPAGKSYEWITKNIGLPFGDGEINSPLGKYTQAIKSGKTTDFFLADASRVTNAHLIAMVPSAGGKMALPAIPETKYDQGQPFGKLLVSLSSDIMDPNLDKTQFLGNLYGPSDVGIGDSDPGTYIEGLNDATAVEDSTNSEYHGYKTNFGLVNVQVKKSDFDNQFDGPTSKTEISHAFVGNDTIWALTGDYGYKDLNSERSLINDYAVDIEDVTNKLNNQYYPGQVYYKSGLPYVGLRYPVAEEDVVHSFRGRMIIGDDVEPGLSNIQYRTYFSIETAFSDNFIPGHPGKNQPFEFLTMKKDTRDVGGAAKTRIFKTDIFAGDKWSTGKKYWDRDRLIQDGDELLISRGLDTRTTADGIPGAKVEQIYKIAGDSVVVGGTKLYTLESDINKGGLSRGNRIFNDSFVGDLYKKDSEYFPKHHSLIEDSKELLISKGKTITLTKTGKIEPAIKQKQVYKIAGDPVQVGGTKYYTLSKESPFDGGEDRGGLSRGDRIFEEGVFTGDFYSKDNAYAKNPKIYIGDKSMLVMGDSRDNVIQLASTRVNDPGFQSVSTTQRHTFTHKFENEGTPLVISSGKTMVSPYNESLTYGQYNPGNESGKGGEYETNPELYQLSTDNTNIKQIGTFSIAGVMDPKYFPIGGGASKVSKDTKKIGLDSIRYTNLLGPDGNILALNLYDGTLPYSKTTGEGESTKVIISSQETAASLLTKTRLQIDDSTKDPIVTIKTKHRTSNPYVARYSTEGVYKALENIKLQHFPLLNEQIGGNLGGENQALGFVKETEGLKGNLFGLTGRYGFGKTQDKYGIGLGRPQGTGARTRSGDGTLIHASIEGGSLPYVSKDVSYEHKFAPDGIKETAPDFKVTKTAQNLGRDFAIVEDGVSRGSSAGIDNHSTLEYKNLKSLGPDPAGDTQHGQLAYETTLRSASELNQTTRSPELASESHPEGEGRRDKAQQDKANVQGQPGKSDTGGAVTTVNDPELKGLVKKSGEKYVTALTDKINMLRYGEDYKTGEEDFIKFKFQDMVNNKWIIFRASLSGINEDISPEWASERYIGRPDSVHVYQGVERTMNFDFIVYPHTRQELPILWEKLNYLVGLAYPTWKTATGASINATAGKRMDSPFINLTIGDMYNRVPGFLASLSIAVDDNSTWEIEEGFQLPKAITVSCAFTHIGSHTLASQGKHYDLGWLKEYDNTTAWTTGDSHLGPNRGEMVQENMKSLLNVV